MLKNKLIISTSRGRFFSVFVNAAIRHKVDYFARSSFGNFYIWKKQIRENL